MRPGANKKIKYDLDVTKLQSLKKGAMTKKVIEGIIKNYPEEKITKKVLGSGTITYLIDINGIYISIYDTGFEKNALIFYEYGGMPPKENILYDYKGENMQYYVTYMFQHRSSLWGLYRLLDEYNTIFQLQNDNVTITAFDSSKSKEKKELQKLIDAIVAEAEKEAATKE